MQEARDVIEALVAEGSVVYGVNTGFGALASTIIEPADTARLQELAESHAAGVGAALPREVVRAMLLLRANTLALGHSGCRPLLVDRLLDLPASGSTRSSRARRRGVGRSAPSPTPRCRSSAAGKWSSAGAVMPAMIGLREAGPEPLELGPKEGLALLNGTQLMGAIGALVPADATGWRGPRA